MKLLMFRYAWIKQDKSSKLLYLKKLQEATSKTNETLQIRTRVETKLQGRPGINTRDSAEKYFNYTTKTTEAESVCVREA